MYKDGAEADILLPGGGGHGPLFCCIHRPGPVLTLPHRHHTKQNGGNNAPLLPEETAHQDRIEGKETMVQTEWRIETVFREGSGG